MQFSHTRFAMENTNTSVSLILAPDEETSYPNKSDALIVAQAIADRMRAHDWSVIVYPSADSLFL
jgi:hypothetical protein